jgi:hypothetical protein
MILQNIAIKKDVIQYFYKKQMYFNIVKPLLIYNINNFSVVSQDCVKYFKKIIKKYKIL